MVSKSLKKNSISRGLFSFDGFQVGGQAGRSYKLEGLEKRDTGGWKIRFGQHFHCNNDFLMSYILDTYSFIRRGLNRAGIEAKAGQGWVLAKAAWGGQQAVRR